MKHIPLILQIMKDNPELSNKEAIDLYLGYNVTPTNCGESGAHAPQETKEPFIAMTSAQKNLLDRLIQKGKLEYLDFENTSKSQASKIIGAIISK